MIGFLFTIAAVHVLAALSPGPDSLLTVRNTLRRGVAAGYATLAGILAGLTVHITLALAGLSLVLQGLPGALRLIALCGGLYLFYLGLRSLTPAPSGTDLLRDPATPHDGNSFLEGLITNLLNTKAFLYFISMFSITLGTDTAPSTRLLAGGIMILCQAIAFAGVIHLTGALRQSTLARSQRILDRAAGIAFLLFAALAILYALNPALFGDR